ncbi:MAG TPA: hypothetical protein VK859_00675, partial [bacterium]|nr:hypothetical protein [bacterium]
ADPRFAQALPDFASEGRRMRAIEQGMLAAQAENQRKSLDSKKAQKAQASQAQKDAQKQLELENFKRDAKNHLESAFGASPLVEGLWQKVLAGPNGESIKMAKTYLLATGKSPEEQGLFMKDFKLIIRRLARPKAERPLAANKPESEPVTTQVPEPPQAVEPAVAQNQPQTTPSSSHPAITGSATAAFPPQPSAEANVPPESPAKAPSPGLFDQVKQAVEKHVGTADSESLAGMATDMLLKDAKQAVNYQIRKGMRNILKDAL